MLHIGFAAFGSEKKEDDRLANSAAVLKDIPAEKNGLPPSILNQAVCVLVFPSVKKIAIGIGGSYGQVRSCAAKVPP